MDRSRAVVPVSVDRYARRVASDAARGVASDAGPLLESRSCAASTGTPSGNATSPLVEVRRVAQRSSRTSSGRCRASSEPATPTRCGGDYRRPPYYPRLGCSRRTSAWDKKVGGFRIDYVARGLTWEKQPVVAAGCTGREREGGRARRWPSTGGSFDGKSSLNEAFVRPGRSREVDLTIARGPTAKSRTVTVKTLYSEWGPRYRDWVARITAPMSTSSPMDASDTCTSRTCPRKAYAEFHRGFLARSSDTRALVVDVRNNGGGSREPTDPREALSEADRLTTLSRWTATMDVSR